jgi:hypothetical protein
MLLFLNTFASIITLTDPSGLVWASNGGGIAELDMPVRGTFLRAYEWWPYCGGGVYEWDSELEMNVGVSTEYHLEAPLTVDLQEYGFNEGDKVMISYQGQLYYSGAFTPDNPRSVNDDKGFWLIGLFSSTSELKQSDELNRVPGAIDAGENYATWPTYWDDYMETVFTTLVNKGVDVSGYQLGSMPTDIPQDFIIPRKGGLSIEVPQDARYLFVCAVDNWYSENMGQITVTISKDTDDDGLLDSWEINGIDADSDGTVDLTLRNADWRHKDIYVEVDFMPGHTPDISALNDVEDAFNNAPVENPDDSLGINLHVEVDYGDNIPHQDVLYGFGDFLAIRDVHFGTTAQRTDPNKANILEAKKWAYHYCLFAHAQAEWDETKPTPDWKWTSSSGRGECPGNDFFVSLGAWTGEVGSTNEQAATFMHELGHNLGLNHGGATRDSTNYKPNYLSVMNYLFQMPYNNPSRPLDYSRYQLPDLDEKSLNEDNGIVGGPYYVPEWLDTVYSKPPNNRPTLNFVSWPIDWNGNGTIDRVNVASNPNNFPQWKYTSPNNELLKGYNDWVNLLYNFRDTSGYGQGAETYFSETELTWETVQLMREEAERRHEVAATNLTVPTGTIGQTGFTVNVTLINLSINPETFNVTVYANTTAIASRTVTLSDNNFTVFSVPCATTGLKIGNYTLTAYVNPLANETNTLDNKVIGGIITIVDKTSPVTTAAYDGLWHNADLTVILNATDNESSVAETYYILDNEDSVKTVSGYGQPRFTADGLNNTLRFWSIDTAGNMEQAKHLSGIKLDKTPPTVTISSPSSGGKVEASAITVAWSGSDATSGVKGYDVRVDGGSWASVGAGVSREFTGLGDGSHMVDVRASDVAGNTKTVSVSFTVDTRPWLIPVVAIGGLVLVAGIIIFLRRSRGGK